MIDYNQNRTQLIQFLQHNLHIHSSNNLVFCTLRFCKQHKTIQSARQQTRIIYSRVLSSLQGKYWHKFPLPSVTVIERGKSNVYHAHTVFNLRDKTLTQFDMALSNTCHTYPYLYLTYDVQYNNFPLSNSFTPVMNHLLARQVFSADVFNYITKEYNFANDKIDFANLFTSELLFNYV